MPKEIGEQIKKTVGVLLGGSGVNASTTKVNSISPKITTAKKVDAIDPSLAGLSAVQLLGSIYEELKKQETARRFESELDSRFQEEINLEEDLRHRELIKALTGRRPERYIVRSTLCPMQRCMDHKGPCHVHDCLDGSLSTCI